MKKYVKPILEIEKYESQNVIAALSVNTNNTLHETEDIYTWEDFWNQ